MANRRMVAPFKPYESKNPNGNEKGYIRTTPSLYYSDAIKDLTALQFRVFVDMRMTAKGSDEVIYTQENARFNLGVCKQSYQTIMDKLELVGLLERKPRSAFSASVYRFSVKWYDYISPRRDIFTGKYERPKKRKNFQPNG